MRALKEPPARIEGQNPPLYDSMLLSVSLMRNVGESKTRVDAYGEAAVAHDARVLACFDEDSATDGSCTGHMVARKRVIAGVFPLLPSKVFRGLDL